MKHIKVNIFTWYFLFLAFCCGLIKNALIIFFIVLIHELGHVFLSHLLGYQISEINIYPFGGITKIKKDVNTPLNREIIIALGGIFLQLLIWLITPILPFTDHTLNLIKTYNLTIMLFNMLPIIPLDGSIFLNALLAKKLSFKKAYFGQIIISVIFLILFSIFNYVRSLNNYLIILFLIYKTYTYFKDYKYLENRFLLERYLKDFPYKKISTQKGQLDILKKDTLHYFREEKGIISEKRKLQERFDKA